jgi:ribose 5-phosphate isomerase A
MTDMTDDARALDAAARRAADLVSDGARVGLGTGRAAAAFIAELGARVRRGLHVVGVPTSRASEALAREAGIKLVALDETLELDLTVDGADEVSPHLDLVKGRGGALVRERIVAAASKRQVIVVGPEKLVRALGERGPIPVEVVPFGVGPALRAVKAMGLAAIVRASGPSDNGNATIDCVPSEPIADRPGARALERALRAIPGVVDTGLFLGTAERVLVGHPDGRVDDLRSEDG